MKYTAVRGTKDILPEEMPYWHYIENTAKSLFEHYNYHEIRTPIFEVSELFEKGIGDGTDIVEKEMYTFTDKGDRVLTLRPEGTAAVVRAYLQNHLHTRQKPVKLYYYGPMFRYERPQSGRYRQFYQIGVENIGSDEPYYDAEMISLCIHLFDDLGLTELSVNINSVGCPVCRPVIEERLKQFLSLNLKKLCKDCNRRFDHQPLRILDCKTKACQAYFSGLPDIRQSLCQECGDHFNSVTEYLDSLGVPYRIDPRLVRGLDYYTRTAFEIVSDQLGAQNAICGGGRYNNLVEQLGGRPTPAIGFAFGVERAVLLLKELSDIILKKEQVVFVAAVGYEQQTRCFHLVQELRRKGLKCDMDYSKKDLKSQLKTANKLGSDYAVIFGEEEAAKNIVIVKNMKTGAQHETAIDSVFEFLDEQRALGPA